MSAITSKVDICNLALSGLGNRKTVTNIDQPKNDLEDTFAIWYDITRQHVLKTLQPNFALNRIVVSAKAVPAAYALNYGYAYEYPQRCLRLLGIGAVDCTDTPPTVEAGLIFLNDYFGNGAPIRFVDDVTNVAAFSPEFVLALAAELAKNVALPVTQDAAKKTAAGKEAQMMSMNSSALNAMENKPIRRSVSRFRQARYGVPSNSEKR